MTATDTWRVVGAGGVRLHVERHGAGGPVAVIAHGVGSSARFVAAAFAQPLASLGRSLVTYDLRGHGGSDPVTDPAEHAFDRHVADLAAVVASCDADVVGGVSLGGHAALGYLARGGDAAAAVACLPAWSGRAVPGEGPHAVVARGVRTRGIQALVADLRQDRSLRPWLRDTLVTDWSRHDAASLTAALVALDGGLAPSELELRDIAAPTAVVAWPDDPGHPLEVARAWVDWLPTAVLTEASLDAMDDGVDHLGRVAVDGLRRVGLA